MRRLLRFASSRSSRSSARAYTLIEILIVVTVLGIAGAMVIPAFAQTGVLRVQSAVRMVVADITEAQSEAIAYQQGRGIKFYAGQKQYKVAMVRGSTLDVNLDLIAARNFVAEDFGQADIAAVSFNSGDTLVFDEMGSPVTAPGSGVAAPNGTVDVSGSGQIFRITVEAYTGRCTVANITP
jgi:prepilin-type N-terminal cleavage/methylation domain-containing protein